MTEKTFTKHFTDNLNSHLQNGKLPWHSALNVNNSPFNPVSGAVYSSVNKLNLFNSNKKDPRWLTAKQAQSLGYQIKKDAVDQKIMFWQFNKEEYITNENGEKSKKIIKLDKPLMSQYSIYNADDLLNENGKAITNLENKVENKTTLNEDQKKYLDETIFNFNDVKPENLVKEIMKAELTAWFLSENYNIDYKKNESSIYIQSCQKLLNENPYEILKIVGDAEKNKNLILEMEIKKEAKIAQENTVLKVNFNDKETVKALGGKWNKEQKTWFAPKGSDLNKFERFLQDMEIEKENTMNEKIYLNVPFVEKEEAKNLGGSWDMDKKQWFITEDMDSEKFTKWFIPEQKLENEIKKEIAQENTYLNVPFSDKEEAKNLGAMWDMDKKSWYAPKGSNLADFTLWTTKNERDLQSPVLDPKAEFKQALENLGLIVDEPIMDGSLQRVSVVGAKKNTKDGAYQAYSDGRPNGWIENHKTGEKSSG